MRTGIHDRALEDLRLTISSKCFILAERSSNNLLEPSVGKAPQCQKEESIAMEIEKPRSVIEIERTLPHCLRELEHNLPVVIEIRAANPWRREDVSSGFATCVLQKAVL